jgi:transcriptional regulator with XRE-family HTH domain
VAGKRTNQYDVDPICDELYQARMAKGLKQAQVGDQIGMSGSGLSSYERGANSPRLETLHAWAEYLNYELVLQKVSAGITKTTPQQTADSVHIEVDRYQAALAMGMLLAAAKDARTDRLAEDLERLADVFAESLGQGR